MEKSKISIHARRCSELIGSDDAFQNSLRIIRVEDGFLVEEVFIRWVRRNVSVISPDGIRVGHRAGEKIAHQDVFFVSHPLTHQHHVFCQCATVRPKIHSVTFGCRVPTNPFGRGNYFGFPSLCFHRGQTLASSACAKAQKFSRSRCLLINVCVTICSNIWSKKCLENGANT